MIRAMQQLLAGYYELQTGDMKPNHHHPSATHQFNVEVCRILGGSVAKWQLLETWTGAGSIATAMMVAIQWLLCWVSGWVRPLNGTAGVDPDANPVSSPCKIQAVVTWSCTRVGMEIPGASHLWAKRFKSAQTCRLHLTWIFHFGQDDSVPKLDSTPSSRGASFFDGYRFISFMTLLAQIGCLAPEWCGHEWSISSGWIRSEVRINLDPWYLTAHCHLFIVELMVVRQELDLAFYGHLRSNLTTIDPETLKVWHAHSKRRTIESPAQK